MHLVVQNLKARFAHHRQATGHLQAVTEFQFCFPFKKKLLGSTGKVITLYASNFTYLLTSFWIVHYTTASQCLTVHGILLIVAVTGSVSCCFLCRTVLTENAVFWHWHNSLGFGILFSLQLLSRLSYDILWYVTFYYHCSVYHLLPFYELFCSQLRHSFKLEVDYVLVWSVCLFVFFFPEIVLWE